MPRAVWLGRARVRLTLVAVMVAMGSVPVMDRGTRWLGSWKLALDQGNGSLILLGPLAAAFSCGVYVRMRRSRVEDLFPQAARPWRAWTAPAIGVWIMGGTALLVLCLSTTTAAWLDGATPYPRLWWVAGCTLLVLGAEVAIGSLVGSLTAHYWAVPWVAVGTFLLFLLTKLSVVPIVFDTGPTTGVLIGETFAQPWFAYQAVVALGLACTAMALSHPGLFRSASLGWKTVTVLAAGAAAVTLVAVPAPLERYVLTSSSKEVCRQGRPVVCLPEDGHRPLDDIAARMQRLAVPLADAGVDLPDRYLTITSARVADSPSGILRFHDSEDLARRVDDSVAAESLAVPRLCRDYSMDSGPVEPEVWLSVQDFLARWLLVRVGDASPPTDDSRALWWTQDVEAQYPWVRATYAALSECRLADLHLPDPPTAG